MPSPVLPGLVAHADWGTARGKRWMACARLQPDRRYLATAPEPVQDAGSLLRSLLERAEGGAVLAGFDFPIGLPRAYAEKVDFVSLLPWLGEGDWGDFYDPAEKAAEIGLRRPFYPLRPGGTRRSHLCEGLGLSWDQLFRVCERRSGTRRAACPLFWILGGNQVGRGAIAGWKKMLAPALRERDFDVALWPFEGDLPDLLKSGRVVVAETYPTEFYRHLGLRLRSKRVQADRQANGSALREAAAKAAVDLAPELRACLDAGFGPKKDGEDPFDAVVGLLGMMRVVKGCHPSGWPQDERIRRVEGWILGMDRPRE